MGNLIRRLENQFAAKKKKGGGVAVQSNAPRLQSKLL